MSSDDNNPLVPDYILRKLLLLYAFTQELKSKVKSNFDPLSGFNGEEYYLINGEWLNKYKNFYNYNQIVSLLQQYKMNYQSFEQFKNNINNILNTVKNFYIKQKSVQFPNELIKGIPFIPTFEKALVNNMSFYNDFYLVNYELNVELSNDKENQIKANYSYVNNLKLKFFLSQNLYFIHGNNFEIGKLNSDGMFIPLFYIKILNGNSEEEIKNVINSGGIEKYLNMKKIDNKREVNKYDNKGGLIFNIEKYKEGKLKKGIKKLEEPKDNINHVVIMQSNNNQNNINNINIFQNLNQDNYTQSDETKFGVQNAKIDPLQKTEYCNQNQEQNLFNGNININIKNI